MKKVIISSCIVITLVISIFAIYKYKINYEQPSKLAVDGTITKIKSLSDLKNKSDLIVDVTGTDKFKIIDYKGIKARISTVKVNEVFKGQKDLKEINILQVESLDIPPENNQRLLLFLRNDSENMTGKPYAVVGAGQGVYIISQQKNDNAVLKLQSLKNDSILKELSGNYDEVKNKLR